MPPNSFRQRSIISPALSGLLFVLGSILVYFAIPTLEKPCHLVTAIASADGTKIYLQTEPPRFGQVEHRYELDLLTGKWMKLHRNEVLCVGHIHQGAAAIRADQETRDSNGVPMFRRWFHVPDHAMATDSPTLRKELWFGKLRWSQTWKQFDRYEMQEYEDFAQTKVTDKAPQFASDLIRTRDGSRLIVCRSQNEKEIEIELWADEERQVLSRWKCRSIAVDDDANQMAMLGATVSGEKKIFVHSLQDGKLIAEYSSPFIGFSSNVYHFSAIARRVLVYDKQSTYLMDLESGYRIPFENNVRRGRRSTDSYGLNGRHVISETQIFDAENGKLLFADNSPISTFRMIIAQTNRVAEVVKSVTATGPGSALVAAPFLTGEVLVKNLEDQSIHQQFQAPTDVHSGDIAILVVFAFWSATWIGYSRIAYSSQGYLICMILYFAILLWLAVYRLENAGLVTQFDRPVKWFLAGLMLGGGTQAALWLWCGAPPFWSRAVLVSLFCAASVLIAKDRVFTRLSSTMDGMLAALLLVLTALTFVGVYIALRWCYGRWYGLHMEPKTHFSILNLLVCVTMVSIIMSVLIPFRKTLLGSVVFEPPASHALLYACSSVPIALILRQLKPRLWCEVLIAFCFLAVGAISARIMFGEMIVSNADAYLSFAGFYVSWALCAVACYGQDFVSSPAPNVQ